MSGSLIVKAHRPGRTALLVGTTVVVSALIGLGLFELGQLRGGFNRDQTGLERELLEAQLAEMDHQNALLRERVALLEESNRIDHAAASQLEVTLQAQDGELSDLKQELAFYRGIVSPADGQAGLRLQELTIEPRPDGDFEYQLVLVQAMRHDRNQAGQARLSIAGMDAGVARVVGFSELAASEQTGVRYDFRYFMHLSGSIRLPDGFVPTELTVTLDPEARGQADLQQSFAWDELVPDEA